MPEYELSGRAKQWLNSNLPALEPLLEVEGAFLWRDVDVANNILRQAKRRNVLKPSENEVQDNPLLTQWELTDAARERIEAYEPSRTLPCGCPYNIISTDDGVKCKWCERVHDPEAVKRHLSADSRKVVTDGGDPDDTQPVFSDEAVEKAQWELEAEMVLCLTGPPSAPKIDFIRRVVDMALLRVDAHEIDQYEEMPGVLIEQATNQLSVELDDRDGQPALHQWWVVEDLLEDRELALVFDHFDSLSQDDRTSAAQRIKALFEMSTAPLIVTAPELGDLVRANPDLRGRVRAIDVAGAVE